MNRSSLLAAFFLSGLISTLGGCSDSTAGTDDADDGALSEAEAGDTVLKSGVYDGSLRLVVADGIISGAYFSGVGDPEHGGATCAFTFGGVVSARGSVQTHILAVDGYDRIKGTIRATAANKLHVTLDELPGGCMRASPVLEKDAGGLEMTRASDESVAKDIVAFRSVRAQKAFFFDAPGGAQRSAYVLSGDTLEQLALPEAGFVKVRYSATKATTGFVKESDIDVAGE